MAQYVLTEYNNKIINGIQLKFNWVHSLQQKYNASKITKFTVRKNIIIILFLLISFLLEILINQYHLMKSRIIFIQNFLR